VGRHARRKTFLFMKADAQGRQGDRHKKLGTSFKMKPNIHPEYRPVAFVDLSINKTFIIPSAVQTRETVEIDGVTYPPYVAPKPLFVRRNHNRYRQYKIYRKDYL
jgi:ribosomal protein L31